MSDLSKPALLALALLAAGCSNRLDGNGDDTGPADTDTEVVDPDGDSDGFPESQDCDDADPDTHPGATEQCDGLDNDCDGVVPPEEGDLDGDGVVECEEFCGAPPGSGTVPTLPDCEYTPSPSGTPFEATVEWSMTQASTDPATGAAIAAYTFADFPEFVNVWQAPMVGQTTDDDFDDDVDGDDVPDIAVVMSDALPGNTESAQSVLRLLSGDGRKVHASVREASFTGPDGALTLAPYKHSGLALGDIDDDGKVEVVLTLSNGTTCHPGAFEIRQVNGTVTLAPDKVFLNEGGTLHTVLCGAHAPALADLDGDGTAEVIVGRNWFDGATGLRESGGWMGRGWYGRAQWGQSAYWNSGYHPIAYDLDGDGTIMEVIAGNAVYKGNGDDTPKGTAPFASWLFCHLVDPDGSGGFVPARDGYAAVADLLWDDGVPEIVITGNEYVGVYDTEPTMRAVTDLHDWDSDANTTETITVPACEQWDQLPNEPDPAAEPDLAGLPAHPFGCNTASQAFGGPPTVADFDGDGDLEIANAGACYYSVFQFDEADGDAFKRFAITPTKDWSSASTGSTVFDFNGDGRSEIVFEDERALYVWQLGDSEDAPWERFVEALRDDNHKSWTIHEYPLVADVDGDGKAEIVVTNSYMPDFPGHYGIYVLGAADDDWVSARPTWSQHGYYVTNANDDLSVGYAARNLDGFRLQSPGAFGSVAAANLTVRAEPPCQEGCGDLTLYVQIANEGEFITASTGVVVGIYGERTDGTRVLLDQRNLTAPVQPGATSPGIGFVVSGWSQYARLVAVVDDPTLGGGVGGWGASRECDESDNEIDVPLDGLCP